MSLQNRLNAKREELEAQQLQEEQAQQAAEQQRQQAIEEAKQRQEEMERQQQEAETQELRETIAKKQEEQQAIQTQVQTIEDLLKGFTQDSKRTSATTEIKNIVHNPENAEVLASMDVHTVADIIRHEEFQGDAEVTNFHSAYAAHGEKKEELRAAREQLKQLLQIDTSEDIGYKDLLARASTQVQRLQEEEHVLSQELPETKAALLAEQERAQQAYLQEHFSLRGTYYTSTIQDKLIYSTKEALKDKQIKTMQEEALTTHMETLINKSFDPQGKIAAIRADLVRIEENKLVNIHTARKEWYDTYSAAVDNLYALLDDKPWLAKELGTNEPDKILKECINSPYTQSNILQQVNDILSQLNPNYDDYTHVIHYLQTLTEGITRWVDVLQNYQQTPDNTNPFFEKENNFYKTKQSFYKAYPIAELTTLRKNIPLSPASQELRNTHRYDRHTLSEAFSKEYGIQDAQRTTLLSQVPDLLAIAHVQAQKDQLSDGKDVLLLQSQNQRMQQLEPQRQQYLINVQELKASPEMAGVVQNDVIVKFDLSERYSTSLVSLTNAETKVYEQALPEQRRLQEEVYSLENKLSGLRGQLNYLGVFQVIEKSKKKSEIAATTQSLEEIQRQLATQEKIIDQHKQAATQLYALDNKIDKLLGALYRTFPNQFTRGAFAVQKGASSLKEFLTMMESTLVREDLNAEDATILHSYEQLEAKEKALKEKISTQ